MCRRQVRAGFGGAYALDYGAVMLTGAALGVRRDFLAEVMAAVEPAILRSLAKE